jgi:hypothetical protein
MLQVLRNQYFDQVITDILTIAPDSLLEIEYKTGIVFLDFPTTPGIGVETVSRLASSRETFVGVAGAPSDFSAAPKPGMKLRQIGGFTTFDDYTAPRQIEILYDVERCGGVGAWVQGFTEDDEISLPTHVLLLHEMRHAVQIIDKKFTFDQAANETLAIEGENTYRRERGLPERGGPGGGCVHTIGFWEAARKSGAGGTGGCFVATAAYGSELDENVEFLRRFRDDVIRATRTGERFWERYWERYERLSPSIVKMIEEDPELRELVRWSLVEPIVHYLEVVQSFPDASLDDVPEPWRAWLAGQRETLARWLESIELPTEFDGMEPDAIVAELTFLLRYVLRTAEARDEYIEQLRVAGVLPLRVEGSVHDRLATQLGSTPATAERREAIVEREEPRTPLLHAYGEHVFSQTDVDIGPWDYSVILTNKTTQTYTAVVLIYTTTAGQSVDLTETAVAPGDVRVFSLGACGTMRSYVVGCYMDDQLVAAVPEDGGEIAPQSAGDPGAADPFRCADWWEIVPP